MRVLVTGSNGFIGKNLVLLLNQDTSVETVFFTRENNVEDFPKMLEGVDWVFHLAGVNRSKNKEDFFLGNTELTVKLCNAIRKNGRLISVVYASSIQASQANNYGKSKRAAEKALIKLRDDMAIPVYIYRLKNIFGKWARPDYNSVVATFCYNLARNLPIKINDSSAIIKLTYIDDVINSFLSLLKGKSFSKSYLKLKPEYKLTVGELAAHIRLISKMPKNNTVEPVGTGLLRALYSTYVSYLSPDCFCYPLYQNVDKRGIFVEMLKTKQSGQFSFFTSHPGITRGGHYHNTKTESFLVVKGEARFRFRHVFTKEYFEIYTSSDNPMIVQTIPGWAHDITNIGNKKLICMLWANEVFNPEKPDTFSYPLIPE